MTQILLVGALKNLWRTVCICILGTLRLRMGASIENVYAGNLALRHTPIRLEFGRRQTIIANLRELRDPFTLYYSSEVINDEEFILLYGVFSSKNLNLPYEDYQRFSFDHMEPDECKAKFRF